MKLLELDIPSLGTLYYHNNNSKPDNYEHRWQVYTFTEFQIKPPREPLGLETYDAVLVIQRIHEIEKNISQIGGGLIASVSTIIDDRLYVDGIYGVGGYFIKLDEICLGLQDPARELANCSVVNKRFNAIDFPELPNSAASGWYKSGV